MKRLSIIVIIATFAVYFFSACESESSSDVNQDRIYVLYEMEYNETTDKTVARASFFFGSITGTKLELADPSKISCNSLDLGFESVFAFYRAEFAGYVDSGDFTWDDTDGNTFINNATINTIDFPETLDTIVKGEAYELTWVGAAMTSAESIFAHIDGDMEEDALNIYQNTASATSVIISANQTDDLTVGTNTIYLRRRNETTAAQATSAGASCAGIYQTLTVNIEVKE